MNVKAQIDWTRLPDVNVTRYAPGEGNRAALARSKVVERIEAARAAGLNIDERNLDDLPRINSKQLREAGRLRLPRDTRRAGGHRF